LRMSSSAYLHISTCPCCPTSMRAGCSKYLGKLPCLAQKQAANDDH
jgi:hypothetical protein